MRFNKIAIQATVRMDADKEAVGLSIVRMHKSELLNGENAGFAFEN